MRATEFVIEAPLQDYVPLNFTDKGTQFKPVDKKLVQHPVNHTKAIKFFENTPYNFRLFFNDMPGLRAYKEGGVASPEQIQKIFGKDSEQILQNSEDAITIVFIGNSGDRAVMMTPWIMAHRFGHAHAASNRRAYGTSGAGGDPWTKAESYFFREINGLLENFYSKETYKDQYYSNVRWKLSPEYNALFNAIGTQRSSRENQIRRPYEFLYEMFAQYLKDGQITLNPIPASLDYGRKAWGRPTKYMSLKPEFRDEMTRQEISQELANQLSNLFNIVLRQSVGKIYVM